ncbi:MAG: methylenetetrahydrofolate reductase [NAD(P)H] [Planctomycetota bacterium]
MHIADIFADHRPTCSFEFFPPRTNESWDRLFDRIADFEALEPSFVSVTYGAGGSTRENTHRLVMKLHEQSQLDPIPHLTCVMHSEADIEAILQRYADAGVSNILALGGDPPKDIPADQIGPQAFPHAVDLVKFIRKFNASGHHADSRGFGIGVAGFPEGHPATPNQLTHMNHLKAKVDAGADYVCTQLFFDNSRFFDWHERCVLNGIDVPLIAGIMPITSIAGMKRMADLAAGTNFPAKLLKAIYRVQDDPDAVRRVGIHHATEQCLDLIDHGVTGIHFYTLNQSDSTREIYRTLGLKTSATLREKG